MGKKNKAGSGTYIEILDERGGTIYQGAITELPLRESYILEKSMELFHEPEPCIIYRTHIAKGFHLELYDMLNRGEQDEMVEQLLCIVDLNIGEGPVAINRVAH